jgi:uncharacterized protein YecE (DUF72 family)
MCTAVTPRNVPAPPLIGTAGWSIPAELRDNFASSGSLLERYAKVFNAVEINSSFYRPHRWTTYERWAASVPTDFRFSVKIPKLITHELKLRDIDAPLKRFFGEVSGLGQKLGAILIQLPPSLAFDQEITADFLSRARNLFDVLLAIEPRHSSWFTAQAAGTLSQSKIERITADPPPCPGAPFWDDAPETRYFRLHGAPRIYYSDYPEDMLAAVARILTVSETDHPNWCIFDNTAAGRATANALSLRRLVAISENCSSRRSTPADRQ